MSFEEKNKEKKPRTRLFLSLAISLLVVVLVCVLPFTELVKKKKPKPAEQAHWGDKARTGKTVRGVNLGSWFIIENWISPSIFLAPDLTEYFIPDEWNYIQVVSNVTSREDAEKRLRNHFDTWITESDFRLIAASGLNTVRLPIPFWTFITSTTIPYLEPYLSNIQKPYIKKALKWAIKYKLDVVLDLHSAPGSQNGDEHSGHQGFIGFGTNPEDIPRAVDALKKMVKLYVNDRSFDGIVKAIGLLNEPHISTYDPGAIPPETLVSFYQEAYDAVREEIDPNAITIPTILLSDGFTPIEDIEGFNQLMPNSSFPPDLIAAESHLYQAFGDQANYTHDQHIESVCSLDSKLRSQVKNRPLVIGEWSLATGPGCTADIFPDCRTFKMQDSVNLLANTSESNVFMRRFFEAQASTFEENSGGWIFWNWKTESVADWSYKAGIEQGWIPTDVSNPSSWAFVPSNNASTCVSPPEFPNFDLEFPVETITSSGAGIVSISSHLLLLVPFVSIMAFYL